MAKVDWHPGELCPHVGFIVANLSRPAEPVVAFYNHRGTAEPYIKEDKDAAKWIRPSCRKFRNNVVRFQLHALADNPDNFMRTLALPREVEHWSQTPLREKLVKIGAKGARPRLLPYVSACRGRDSSATGRGNPANVRLPAAAGCTDMTPPVIVAGLNRWGTGSRRLSSAASPIRMHHDMGSDAPRGPTQDAKPA